MEFIKSKLKFKFELPISSLQEINNLKDIAAKKPNIESNKGFKRKTKSFSKTVKIKKPQALQPKTSKKVLPPYVKLMIGYLNILRDRYPNAFPNSTRVSLKTGIVKDIASALNISNNTAKKFMYWYTTSGQYLKNHKEGSPRYDLNGNIVGYVTCNESQDKSNFTHKIWSLNNGN